MSEGIVSIIVIVVTAAVISLIFLLVNRRKKQREALIEHLAVQHDWRYQKIHSTYQDGYTLQGNGWIFECVATSSRHPSQSGSSTVSYSNRWFSDLCTSPTGMVLIGPKLPSIKLGGLGDFVLQQALKLMLGDDAGEAAGLAEVVVGRSSLRERYSIWATSESAASEVLTFDVENALVNWKIKEKPVIRVYSRGTEIRLKDGRVEKPDDIQAVVKLGEAFIRS